MINLSEPPRNTNNNHWKEVEAEKALLKFETGTVK
jgi:hypothetical protein